MQRPACTHAAATDAGARPTCSASFSATLAVTAGRRWSWGCRPPAQWGAAASGTGNVGHRSAAIRQRLWQCRWHCRIQLSVHHPIGCTGKGPLVITHLPGRRGAARGTPTRRTAASCVLPRGWWTEGGAGSAVWVRGGGVLVCETGLKTGGSLGGGELCLAKQDADSVPSDRVLCPTQPVHALPPKFKTSPSTAREQGNFHRFVGPRQGPCLATAPHT